jgi:DUF1365 family protein
MDNQYEFHIECSAQHIILHMKNCQNKVCYFDATLSLTNSNQHKKLLRYIFMQFKITLAIYWQAFQIWLKGVKCITHPKRTQHVVQDE